MKELAENYKRMIALRAQQQEQPSEEVLSSEVQTIYQEFYQKLKEKHLTEEETEDLKQRYPELYDMVKSLEREMAACQEKLRLCRTKEDVQEMWEAYEGDLLRGVGLPINNQAVPLIKKLEYTMFKDTKRSFIEDIIDKFIESDAYKKLPGETAEEEADMMTEEEEEAIMQRARHERARASYEGVRSLGDEKAESGTVLQASFDVKG